jgi:hypothetical protein
MSRCLLYYRPGHPRANAHGFVDSRDLEEVPPDPKHVPIVTDLYMDGTVTTDGVDIGSRRKRQRYMQETDSRDATDYSRGYYEGERRYRERQEERGVKQSVIDAYRRLRKV